MRERFFLIDGNSVGYAQHCGCEPLSVSGDHANPVHAFVPEAEEVLPARSEIQGLFGLLRFMKNLLLSDPGRIPVVLWDGRADWRYALHPEYKSDRERDAESLHRRRSFRRQLPFIHEALHHLGVPQLKHAGSEADDLAAVLTRSISRDAMESGVEFSVPPVVVVSSDQDWLQLVNPYTIWQEGRNDKQAPHGSYRTVTLENFQEFTGFRAPRDFVEGLALTGDKSDSIPGIPMLGEKTAIKLLGEYGSVREFFLRHREIEPKGRVHQRLNSTEGRAQYALNNQLVNLIDLEIPHLMRDVQFDRGHFDMDSFLGLCEVLEFKTILFAKREYMRAFGRVSLERVPL